MANVGDQDKSNIDMLIGTDYIADTEGQGRNIDIDNGINDNDALSLSEMTTNKEEPTPSKTYLKISCWFQYIQRKAPEIFTRKP